MIRGVVSQADRLPGRAPAAPLSHLEGMSAQNGDSYGERGSPAAGARGKPSGPWVTYVPYDPSYETPDEGEADSMNRRNT
jgi:hypothetical protein